MTLGEKITQLRSAVNMTQEELAERLVVSRQSVSKWEMNQAQPQLDKILMLCQLFKLSCDELLLDSVSIGNVGKKNKYFGTDGFRGEANVGLTSMHAYKVGRFLGWYFASSLSGVKKPGYRPRIVIGKDTRRSSYMLEYSIVAGITASGADAYMLHVMLNAKGIEKVKAPDFIIRRWGDFWDSKDEATDDRIQTSATNKFLINLVRLDQQFNGIDITAVPNDIDSFLHLKLDKDISTTYPTLDAFFESGKSAIIHNEELTSIKNPNLPKSLQVPEELGK